MKKMKTAPSSAPLSRRGMGFTLAEILITLSIIGVAAALTIPTLIQRTGTEEFVSRLNKAYSTLSQATEAIMTEKGAAAVWATNTANTYNSYKEHLRISKDCGTSTGCWKRTLPDGRDGVLKLDGGEEGFLIDSSEIYEKFILSDGASVAINLSHPNCNGGGLTSIWGRNVCGYICVDINGSKRPNQWGRDIFEFVLTKDGLYPAGTGDSSADYMNTCNKAGDSLARHGKYCTARVIAEGDMNY